METWICHGITHHKPVTRNLVCILRSDKQMIPNCPWSLRSAPFITVSTAHSTSIFLSTCVDLDLSFCLWHSSSLSPWSWAKPCSFRSQAWVSSQPEQLISYQYRIYFNFYQPTSETSGTLCNLFNLHLFYKAQTHMQVCLPSDVLYER